MKIIFLSRFYFPHIGGVEKHVEGLTKELIKKGFQPTIITTQHDGAVGTQEFHDQAQIYRIPRDYNSKSQIWSWMIANKRLFQAADLVHAHDVFWWYMPLRILLYNKPVFTTFHGWEGIFPPTKKAILHRKIVELASDNNVCVGDFIKKWYKTKPGLVTHGATDQKPLPPGDINRILVLGRLERDTDVHLKIEATKMIKQKVPGIKIRFCGDGECSYEAGKVGKVLGFKRDIVGELQMARWVFASSYLSILDALAAGRKVFSIYSNPLKKDYLTTHPAARWLSIADSPKTLANQFVASHKKAKKGEYEVGDSTQWAAQQTWKKLADQYIKLWSTSSYTVAKLMFPR